MDPIQVFKHVCSPLNQIYFTLGKVWTCRKCGNGYTRFENFDEHSTDDEHKPLFEEYLQRSFGRARDKHKQPYGCPPSAESEMEASTARSVGRLNVKKNRNILIDPILNNTLVARTNLTSELIVNKAFCIPGISYVFLCITYI